MAQNFTYFTQWIRMGISYLYFPLREKFCANNRRYHMQGVSSVEGTPFLPCKNFGRKNT